jgi:hypothetical protein
VTAPVSKKPLRVGVFGYDVTAIYAVFGKSGDAPSDFYAPYRAMAKYMNDRGGVGGRKIVLLTHTADSGGDASTEGQKACAAFTQDNKVDIVYDAAGSNVLAACLKQRGIASITGGNVATDGVDANSNPNLLLPSAMRLDRLFRALLEVSEARGTLKRGDKLGVLTDSCPAGRRIYDSVFVPFAKRMGVGLVEASITCSENISGIAAVSNDTQRATLQFASAHVTHVVALHAAEAFILSQFTTNASQQKYYPKYLVTSNAYAWQNSQKNATVVTISQDAVPNISGVGFLPFFDVGAGAHFGAAQARAQAVCTKADPSQFGAAAKSDHTKYFALNTFYSQCSAFMGLKDVLEAGGMRLDYRSVRAGFNKVKDAHTVSAALNSGQLGGPDTSTDGAGLVQAFVYDPKKTFVYVGAPVAVS